MTGSPCKVLISRAVQRPEHLGLLWAAINLYTITYQPGITSSSDSPNISVIRNIQLIQYYAAHFANKQKYFLKSLIQHSEILHSGRCSHPSQNVLNLALSQTHR